MSGGTSDTIQVRTLSYSISILNYQLSIGMNAPCAHPQFLFVQFVRFVFKNKNNMKINWTKVFKVLKFVGTVLTTIAGTLAVQNCTPTIF